jgi:E3 ubiquitin-protein ligase NEDD4
MYICLRGVKSPGTGVTDSCELPCGFWELNLGPLEKQQVLLTAEPTLQLPDLDF